MCELFSSWRNIQFACFRISLSFVVADLRSDFQHYLDNLEFSTLKDLRSLINFNIEHKDEELPPSKLPPSPLYNLLISGCSRSFESENIGDGCEFAAYIRGIPHAP